MKPNDYICTFIIAVVMILASLAFADSAFSARPGMGMIPDNHQRQMVNPMALKNEADVQEYLAEKFDIFIDSVTWCFKISCNNMDAVNALGEIIKSYGWDEDNFGIVCVFKIKKINNEGPYVPYLDLRIVMLSKIHPDKRYLHDWELYPEPSRKGI